MHLMPFFELIYTLYVDKFTIGIRVLRQAITRKTIKN